MESPWPVYVVHGLSMDSPWIGHALCVDSTWIARGQSLDFAWTVGSARIAMIFSWTARGHSMSSPCTAR
eukprot:4835014-Lingulodinium_polyedra.AAC.1